MNAALALSPSRLAINNLQSGNSMTSSRPPRHAAAPDSAVDPASSETPNSVEAPSFELAILARGEASLSPPRLADARQTATNKFSAVLKPQLLKHSDPQTLAAVEALMAATDRLGRLGGLGVDGCFADWAIFSATQYLGRAAFAAVIEKYKLDGPWGVSVQVIPHTSPHAVASTLSLALATHGPCIGVGAAPGEEPQALLTAASLLQRPEIPGAWLVLSGWSSEPSLESGASADAARCRAAVLAVVGSHSPEAGHAIGRIRFQASGGTQGGETANLLDWLADGPCPFAATYRANSGELRVCIEWFAEAEQRTRSGRSTTSGPMLLDESPALPVAAPLA
jgi:hypothetical protein